MTKQYYIIQNKSKLQYTAALVKVCGANTQTSRIRSIYNNMMYYTRKEIMIDDEIMVGRRRPLYSQTTSYNIYRRRSQCIYNNIKTYMFCVYTELNTFIHIIYYALKHRLVDEINLLHNNVRKRKTTASQYTSHAHT